MPLTTTTLPANPGWIGDRKRSGGLLDRVIGYVIDAAFFGAGTAIGGTVYIFAAWVILYEVTLIQWWTEWAGALDGRIGWCCACGGRRTHVVATEARGG